MKLRNNIFIFFSFPVFLFLSSCSQQKNRWLNRTYHSTTTRYNIYFNGNESFKDGVFAIESANKDDFSKILPVFIYGDESAAKSAFPQMDNAIKKASKSVQRHSMYIKEVEYNEWIDDCYLLVGKAEFYKREYRKAIMSFEYVAKDFKHREIKHDAMLWLVRSYIELNDFNNANKFLNLIIADVVATDKGIVNGNSQESPRLGGGSSETKTENKKQNKKSSSKKPAGVEEKKKELAENHVFPQRLKADYYGVAADFYIKQNKEQSAIPELLNCISLTKKKKRKVRLYYILAQLEHKTGNYEMAVRHYAQVLQLRPPYEMEFYAQINRAMAYDVGAGSSVEIKAQLHKMMKDEKNKEFFDQIYYALADIEIKEGNEEKGIEYLKTSTKKSISNSNQKGLSFLRLANIYFDKKQYPPAQINYDSAVAFLNKDRADYSSIVSQRNNLTKLVKNILLIEKEDSLQQLATLSEKERNKIIDGIIQKIIDEEEQKKQEQQQAAQFPQNATQQQQQGATAGGEWYFYNPSTLGFGFAEFKKIWGDRIPEDNWRRKNKSLAAIDAGTSDLIELEEKDTAAANLKDRNYYLKNIPLTNEKLNKSHNKMMEAYYDLGLVYREQFENHEMAKKTFETLIQKYDTCRYVLPSCYQLYKIYAEEKNYEKADFYKNKILKEFPNSEYAKILLNPDYFVEIFKEKSKSEELYKTTYQLYKEQYFSQVIANCDASDSLFPENHLAPKFHFLKALAAAKTGDLKLFETALNAVIEKYPQDEVAVEARIILDLLLKNKPVEQVIDTSVANYRFKPDIKHSCLLIIPLNENANDIKIAVADFNNKFFSLAKLNVSDALLDNERQMISIKYFDDAASATTYFKAFKNDEEILKDINAKGYALFLISSENFPIFYNHKKEEEYLSFFSKNYPMN